MPRDASRSAARPFQLGDDPRPPAVRFGDPPRPQQRRTPLAMDATACAPGETSFQNDVMPSNKTPLGGWLHNQKKHYKAKTYIMKNEEIRKEFETLIAEFPLFFRSNEEIWRDNLRATIQFIQKEKRRPTAKKEKQLGKWLDHQLAHYKAKTQIMQNEDIRKEFEEFCKRFNI